MAQVYFFHGTLAALVLMFLVFFTIGRIRRLSAQKSVRRMEAELMEARGGGLPHCKKNLVALCARGRLGLPSMR